MNKITADHLARDPALAGFRVRISGDAAVANVDSEQLQIVFQNILMNAAQATNNTGEVDVSVQRTSTGWTLAFEDNGPGMPSEVREKAFEAFFTTKHRGTGLGLPTARRIVEAHGGTIDVASRPAGGTVVTIHLPA